jgi:hypothetical protein
MAWKSASRVTSGIALPMAGAANGMLLCAIARPLRRKAAAPLA